MEEDLKKTSHISYKEYKKKINQRPNESIAIFVSAFFILLLLFLGIAKQISPEIDVNISDENSTEKTLIDNRLKLIQQEDEDKMFAPELDEKVVIPEKKNVSEQIDDNTIVEEQTPAIESASPKPETTASPEPVQQNAKVVVGYYSTKEQAEVAKGIISEAGLNISPFVRSIGGAFTIQIGSYSSRDKAQSVVNELLRNNYPARIIME